MRLPKTVVLGSLTAASALVLVLIILVLVLVLILILVLVVLVLILVLILVVHNEETSFPMSGMSLVWPAFSGFIQKFSRIKEKNRKILPLSHF